MRVLYLDPTKEMNGLHELLCEALQETAELGANVFNMLVRATSREVEFVTTSKEIFLFLGRLGWDGRTVLADVLLNQLEDDRENQLLFQFRRVEKDPDLCTKKSMVVTRTYDQSKLVFSFAPA